MRTMYGDAAPNVSATDQAKDRPMTDHVGHHYQWSDRARAKFASEATETRDRFVRDLRDHLRAQRVAVAAEIRPFTIIETRYERGLVVVSDPDTAGTFYARNLDGVVECYKIAEVTHVGRECFR